MNKKKVKELIEQILKYCDQCYNPNWQPKSFEEFVKLGNICREAIKELSKSDWISVEDRLPLYDEKVFVCNKRHPNDVWKSFRLEKKGTDVISVNLNKTLDVNGFVIHKGNIPITHWRRIEKLEG